MIELLLNKSDLNFVYTSDHFIPEKDKAFFNDNFQFVDLPAYTKNEDASFPFEKLKNKKVIYVSLGNVFSKYKSSLYNILFEAFGNTDAVVVITANKIDLSKYIIPNNFIVRDYVPQSAILQHTDVAITNGDMNSINDLIYYHIPFVTIPLGANQSTLAKKAKELNAAITLNANELTASELKEAVDKVMNDVSYLANINFIRQSFIEAGGYKKAANEILKFTLEKNMLN